MSDIDSRGRMDFVYLFYYYIIKIFEYNFLRVLKRKKKKFNVFLYKLNITIGPRQMNLLIGPYTVLS